MGIEVKYHEGLDDPVADHRGDMMRWPPRWAAFCPSTPKGWQKPLHRSGATTCWWAPTASLMNLRMASLPFSIRGQRGLRLRCGPVQRVSLEPRHVPRLDSGASRGLLSSHSSAAWVRRCRIATSTSQSSEPSKE